MPYAVTSAQPSCNRFLESRACATIAKIALTVFAIGMTVLTCCMAAGMVGGARAPFAGILLSPGMGCVSILASYLLISENFPSLRVPENLEFGLGMVLGTVVVLSLFAGAAGSGVYIPL